MTTKKELKKIIREEYTKILVEVKEKAPDIEAALEKLRKKLEPEMTCSTTLGGEALGGSPASKRIALKTVSELLDIPVNELILHFKNTVNTKNERSLVEYRLGHVYFFKDKQ